MLTALVVKYPTLIEADVWILKKSHTTSTQMAAGQVRCLPSAGDQPCKFLILLQPGNTLPSLYYTRIRKLGCESSRVRDIEVTILALVFIVAHVVVYIIH
jgi:hypothetical protein